MIRKNYMMIEDDIVKLKEKMPFVSEATLIRASIRAALKLSKEEFSFLCLEVIRKSGPK